MGAGLNEQDFKRSKEHRRNHSCIVYPSSLAATKGILVSFFFYTALTNMLKFSAFPRLAETHWRELWTDRHGCDTRVVITMGT